MIGQLCNSTISLLHSRSQYTIQEAYEETAKSVLISLATITGCVDLHGRCISWSLCIAFHIGKVKPVFACCGGFFNFNFLYVHNIF